MISGMPRSKEVNAEIDRIIEVIFFYFTERDTNGIPPSIGGLQSHLFPSKKRAEHPSDAGTHCSVVPFTIVRQATETFSSELTDLTGVPHFSGALVFFYHFFQPRNNRAWLRFHILTVVLWGLW